MSEPYNFATLKFFLSFMPLKRIAKQVRPCLNVILIWKK